MTVLSARTSRRNCGNSFQRGPGLLQVLYQSTSTSRRGAARVPCPPRSLPLRFVRPLVRAWGASVNRPQLSHCDGDGIDTVTLACGYNTGPMREMPFLNIRRSDDVMQPNAACRYEDHGRSLSCMVVLHPDGVVLREWS